ncbi:MAG TPA: type II toxin-antitoxin system VapC family toxin [Candidatus Acidoferrum sp.]|nr:type II toxin-antitoxin system VapC family toxin [Candidatus Acidoferrum sp.]
MSGYLLDTNVLSEGVKLRPDLKVKTWVDSIDEQLVHVSVLTLGEIRKGIESLPLSARRATLESWLVRDLVVRFAGRILQVDQEVADRWGRLVGKAKAENRPLPAVDGLLAATAMEHNLTLVTRNTRDVLLTGVPVFNPWES